MNSKPLLFCLNSCLAAGFILSTSAFCQDKTLYLNGCEIPLAGDSLSITSEGDVITSGTLSEESLFCLTRSSAQSEHSESNEGRQPNQVNHATERPVFRDSPSGAASSAPQRPTEATKPPTVMPDKEAGLIIHNGNQYISIEEYNNVVARSSDLISSLTTIIGNLAYPNASAYSDPYFSEEERSNMAEWFKTWRLVGYERWRNALDENPSDEFAERMVLLYTTR